MDADLTTTHLEEKCFKIWNECAYDAYSNAFYFFGKERHFFSLALIYKDNLYENGYEAFDIYR